MAKPEPSWMMWPSNSSWYPGNTGSRSLASFTPARAGSPEKPLIALVIQPHVCAMHSISSTPGIRGKPGKCPSKTGLDAGTVQAVRIVRALASTARNRSIIWKYSRRIRNYRVSEWGLPGDSTLGTLCAGRATWEEKGGAGDGAGWLRTEEPGKAGKGPWLRSPGHAGRDEKVDARFDRREFMTPPTCTPARPRLCSVSLAQACRKVKPGAPSLEEARR